MRHYRIRLLSDVLTESRAPGWGCIKRHGGRYLRSSLQGSLDRQIGIAWLATASFPLRRLSGRWYLRVTQSVRLPRWRRPASCSGHFVTLNFTLPIHDAGGVVFEGHLKLYLMKDHFSGGRPTLPMRKNQSSSDVGPSGWAAGSCCNVCRFSSPASSSASMFGRSRSVSMPKAERKCGVVT